MQFYSFFFNDTATTEIYTLSLHDALPIYITHPADRKLLLTNNLCGITSNGCAGPKPRRGRSCHRRRSEEHTSELQSRLHLVCRLLLEKKKRQTKPHTVGRCCEIHGTTHLE